MRYGGNTSSVEVRMGGEIILLDAGTGLRALGRSLLEEFKGQPLNLTLLLTHTHWDHIQGLPFFGPIYDSRCRLRILGCEGARKGLVNALTGQMESTYFPVPFNKLPSNIEIEELKNFNFNIGPVCVRAMRANHPGLCVGYRLFSPDSLVAFFPDAEPRQGGEDREMIEFLRDVDLLILDSQYGGGGISAAHRLGAWVCGRFRGSGLAGRRQTPFPLPSRSGTQRQTNRRAGPARAQAGGPAAGKTARGCRARGNPDETAVQAGFSP